MSIGKYFIARDREDDGFPVGDDGVSLRSVAHPRDPKLLERLARAACKADGVDPAAEGYGLDHLMSKGARYPLWKARLKLIEAVLDELAAADAELGAISDDALETVEITVRRSAADLMAQLQKLIGFASNDMSELHEDYGMAVPGWVVGLVIVDRTGAVSWYTDL